MSTYNSFVATYAHHDLAELDIEKMQNAGFDEEINQIKCIADSTHQTN